MLASSSEQQQTDNETHHDEDFSYVGKNLNHSTHQHEKKERIIPENKLTGYEFWKSIGSPKHVVAPMVDQSELAFRLLAQNHGSTLAYTPMFHGRIFVQDETYQKTHFQFLESEGPVFAQFCANDPNIFVECGWLAWELSNQKIAAVDLNLGCPQRIAKKGRYGSYLMEDIDLICSMIEKAHKELPVPVTAKIRIFDDAEHTLKYVDRILEAGAQVLCVHGRTRDQRGHNQNYADWKMIKLIREHVPHIPVIANGNIRMYQDIIDCLEYTGADAVMSADPLLCNPALFNGGHHVNAIDLCEEYINICEKYPPPDHSFIKRHLFQMLDHTLGTHNHLRASLAKASGIQKYREFVNHLRENKDSLVVDPPVYEPSIMVVKDPKNHPIDKKPRGRGCKPCDDELVPGINDN